MIVDGHYLRKIPRTRRPQGQKREVYPRHEQEQAGMEGRSQQAPHQVQSQQGSPDLLGGQEEASRSEESFALSDKRVQREEDSQEKIDEGAEEAEKEAKDLQRNQVWTVLGDQEHQEHEEVEQKSKGSTYQTSSRNFRKSRK